MATSFQETDTAVTTALAAFCSALSLSTGTTDAQDASVGGAAGTSHSFSVQKSGARAIAVGFELPVASGSTWAAGTWTVRLNITTANSALTLEDIFICRVNSSGVSQATIGSLSSIAASLGATGVISKSITGAAQTPSAGDKVYIVFSFTNSNSMTTQSAAFTADQLIDSPFTGVSPISGSSNGQASVSATLKGTGALSGTATGVATDSATLKGAGVLAGSVTGHASLSATLIGAGALQGNSAGHTTTTGALKGVGALSGSALGHAADSATLKGSGFLGGSVIGHTTVSGTGQTSGGGAIAGTVSGHAIVSGTLTATGILTGSAAGKATVSSTLKGSGALQGNSSGHVTSTATLKGTGALAGSVSGHTTVSGTMVQPAGQWKEEQHIRFGRDKDMSEGISFDLRVGG